MLFTQVFTQALLFSLVSAAAKKPNVKDTDVGSLLKSMDQTKLKSIPADARAVMVKMPEKPETVNAADRSALDQCLASTTVDTLGKEACAAQKDQISAVIDKQKNVSNANMGKFVTDAMAAGATMPKPEKKKAGKDAKAN